MFGILSRLKRRSQKRTPDTTVVHRDPRSKSELKSILAGLLEAEMDRRYAKSIANAPTSAKALEREAHKKLGTTLSLRLIETLSKDELAVLIEAAAHPDYRLVTSLRWNETASKDRRDIALFFPVLHASELDPKLSYSNALYCLREAFGCRDLLVLHRKTPEAASGLLLLITYFMKHGMSVGPVHPEIRKMIMDDPEISNELLDFIKDRKIQSFHYLDPEVFKESRTIEAKPLRDGFL